MSKKAKNMSLALQNVMDNLASLSTSELQQVQSEIDKLLTQRRMAELLKKLPKSLKHLQEMNVTIEESDQANKEAEDRIDYAETVNAVEVTIANFHLIAATGNRTGTMYAGTTYFSTSDFICGPVHVQCNFPGAQQEQDFAEGGWELQQLLLEHKIIKGETDEVLEQQVRAILIWIYEDVLKGTELSDVSDCSQLIRDSDGLFEY